MIIAYSTFGHWLIALLCGLHYSVTHRLEFLVWIWGENVESLTFHLIISPKLCTYSGVRDIFNGESLCRGFHLSTKNNRLSLSPSSFSFQQPIPRVSQYTVYVCVGGEGKRNLYCLYCWDINLVWAFFIGRFLKKEEFSPLRKVFFLSFCLETESENKISLQPPLSIYLCIP